MRPCAFGVSLMDEAANPDAGWKFIQWMTEPETQIEWYKTATVLPSSQSAWEDEVLAGGEKLAAYGEQLKSTQAPPAVPTWAQVSAAVLIITRSCSCSSSCSATSSKAWR